MKILIRNEKSKRWDVADPVKPKAEEELQILFFESPSLIPVDDIRTGVTQLVFSVREFGLPGSGSTDVIAFTAEGDIAIIECKRAANPESKRKVIGQIFEYAAYLWGMSYKELNERIQAKMSKSLSSLVEEAVAGAFDEEVFITGVEQSLAKGNFLLIIVVDEINEELRRIIRYLNECSKSEYSFHALEVPRFQAEGVEVLVPHLHGVSVRTTPPAGERKKWSEDEFFEDFREKNDKTITKIAEDLAEWAKSTADRVWFGTGKATGSLTFHYLHEGKTLSVFSIFTTGKIVLNYGWLSRQVSPEIMAEFHQKITEIPALKKLSDDFSKWPSFNIADLFKNAGDMEKFKKLVEWLKTRVEG